MLWNLSLQPVTVFALSIWGLFYSKGCILFLPPPVVQTLRHIYLALPTRQENDSLTPDRGVPKAVCELSPARHSQYKVSLSCHIHRSRFISSLARGLWRYQPKTNKTAWNTLYHASSLSHQACSAVAKRYTTHQLCTIDVRKA